MILKKSTIYLCTLKYFYPHLKITYQSFQSFFLLLCSIPIQSYNYNNWTAPMISTSVVVAQAAPLGTLLLLMYFLVCLKKFPNVFFFFGGGDRGTKFFPDLLWSKTSTASSMNVQLLHCLVKKLPNMLPKGPLIALKTD